MQILDAVKDGLKQQDFEFSKFTESGQKEKRIENGLLTIVSTYAQEQCIHDNPHEATTNMPEPTTNPPQPDAMLHAARKSPHITNNFHLLGLNCLGLT